jgi:hypothetical protein
VVTSGIDPDFLSGWGVRPNDWHYSLSIQQQLLARASVDIAYTRRTFHRLTAADNTLTSAADYRPYSVRAPVDSRLPGGGGYVIDGLYNITPALFGTQFNVSSDSRKFGKDSQYFNGVDLTLNVRVTNGLTFQGGSSFGRTVADVCSIREVLPEFGATIGAGNYGSAVSVTSPYCHVDYGWLTDFRALSSYILPKIDVQVSGTMQSKPGRLLSANYAVPRSEIEASLGGPIAGGVPNVTVNLIKPGDLYGDRVNELDLRLAKIFRFSGRRATIGLDIYNALNASPILTYDSTYVPNGSWLLPTSVMTARMFRISAEFDF